MKALNKDMPSHTTYCVRVICEENVQCHYFSNRRAADDFINDFDESELKYLDVQYMGVVYTPNYTNKGKDNETL